MNSLFHIVTRKSRDPFSRYSNLPDPVRYVNIHKFFVYVYIYIFEIINRSRGLFPESRLGSKSICLTTNVYTPPDRLCHRIRPENIAVAFYLPRQLQPVFVVPGKNTIPLHENMHSRNRYLLPHSRIHNLPLVECGSSSSIGNSSVN